MLIPKLRPVLHTWIVAVLSLCTVVRFALPFETFRCSIVLYKENVPTAILDNAESRETISASGVEWAMQDWLVDVPVMGKFEERAVLEPCPFCKTK